MSRRLLAPIRVLLFMPWTFLAGGMAGVARNLFFWDRCLGTKAAAWWTSLWGRGGVWLLGCKFKVVGPRPAPGSFVASNHTTWADILVLGGASPALFIAKAEIAGWPIFGFLARNGSTLFVDRNRMRDTARLREELRWYLENDITVNIFAEGGAGCGEQIRKYRAPLFETPSALNVPCVPAVIKYSDKQAWWPEDQGLRNNVRLFASLPNLSVEVRFGEPVTDISNRKELAAELQHRCAELYRD